MPSDIELVFQLTSIERDRFLRRPRTLWCMILLTTGLILSLFLLRNPYAFGMYPTDPSFVLQPANAGLLTIVVGCFYLVPIFAVLLTFDWLDDDPAALGVEGLSDGPEVRRRIAAGRVHGVTLVIMLSYLAAATVHLLRLWALGDPLIMKALLRTVFLGVLVWLYAIGLAFLFAAVSLLARTSERALVWSMLVLTAIVVGFPLISDQVMLYTLGPMPMPGTADWMAYLENSRMTPAILIYFLSPTETFLYVATNVMAQPAITPQMQGQTIFGMALLPVTFALIFRVVHGLTARRRWSHAA